MTNKLITCDDRDPSCVSLLKIKPDGKKKPAKIISKMEEQKLVISKFKVQSILFLKKMIITVI